ncbi:hypothetical protein KY334_06180 [Candidatus Woesearchaeota archaeon]|nr:hypothetical protein [Candidatus Woesearchaeota archaeon]
MEKTVIESKIIEIKNQKGTILWPIFLSQANELAKLAYENGHEDLRQSLISISQNELRKAIDATHGDPYKFAPFLKTNMNESLEDKLNNRNINDFEGKFIKRRDLRNLFPSYFEITDKAKFLEREDILHPTKDNEYFYGEIKKYIELVDKLNAEIIYSGVVDELFLETEISKSDIRYRLNRIDLVKKFPIGRKVYFFKKDEKHDIINRIMNYYDDYDEAEEMIERKKISSIAFDINTYDKAIKSMKRGDYLSQEYNEFAKLISHAATEFYLNDYANKLFKTVSHIYNISYAGLEEITSISMGMKQETKDRLLHIAKTMKKHLEKEEIKKNS